MSVEICNACTCDLGGVVNKFVVLNPKDFIIENGVIIRPKRKYGKFNRKMYVIDNNPDENQPK